MSSFDLRWGGWPATALKGLGFLALLGFGCGMGFLAADWGGGTIRGMIADWESLSNFMLEAKVVWAFVLTVIAFVFFVGTPVVVVQQGVPWLRRRISFHTRRALRFGKPPSGVPVRVGKPTEEDRSRFLEECAEVFESQGADAAWEHAARQTGKYGRA